MERKKFSKSRYDKRDDRMLDYMESHILAAMQDVEKIEVILNEIVRQRRYEEINDAFLYEREKMIKRLIGSFFDNMQEASYASRMRDTLRVWK